MNFKISSEINIKPRSNLLSGITLLEVLIVLAIITILSVLSLTAFVNFKKNEALKADTKLIVEVLREARNKTLTSQNDSQYGVHFSLSPSQAVIFVGSVYNAGSPTNKVYDTDLSNVISTITLNGGGNDIIFNRLTGETDQNGTIVISSKDLSISKTITIFKTGSIDSQ